MYIESKKIELLRENRPLTVWNHWPPQHTRVTFNCSGSDELLPLASPEVKTVTYTYDPLDPVPTCGGGVLLGGLSGCRLQPEPGYRSDVVTLCTPPLEEAIFLAGNIKATLYVSSTAEDAAFSVKIMEVFPEGNTYNIVDGITSLQFHDGLHSFEEYRSNEMVKLDIELWSIAWKIRSGSRIRLDISSSNYPAYHAHPNVRGLWSEQIATIKAEQTLYWGGQYPSCLSLPVVAGQTIRSSFLG